MSTFNLSNKDDKVYTPGELNSLIKNNFLNSFPQNKFKVCGRIVNLNLYTNSRNSLVYFSLEDEDKNSINLVVYASQMAQFMNIEDLYPLKKNELLNVTADNEFIATVSVSFYVKKGLYNCWVLDLQISDKSKAALEYKKLKEEFGKKGYFLAENKKLLPKYPQQIAIITSEQGAVKEDIKNTINRLAPWIKIKFYYSSIQGLIAESEIIKRIIEANDELNNDAIIIARGGGSESDFDVFNKRNICEQIFKSKIPIITALGHAINETLSDLIADLSVVTPTGAAEEVARFHKELPNKLNAFFDNFYSKMDKIILLKNNVLQNNSSILYKNSPMNIIDRRINILNEFLNLYKQNISNIFNKHTEKIVAYQKDLFLKIKDIYNDKKENFSYAIKHINLWTINTIMNNKDKVLKLCQSNMKKTIEAIIKEKENICKQMVNYLDLSSPTKILQKGYSIAYKDNVAVSSIAKININDNIKTTLTDGYIYSQVKKISKK